MYFNTADNLENHKAGFSFGNKNDPAFDSRNYISNISINDVEYLPVEDPRLTKNYNEISELTFDNGKTYYKVPVADVRTLGKFKTIHWDYECETRIVCRMGNLGMNLFNYIDLRLKDNFFKNMDIIMSPWADKNLEKSIGIIIENCNLSEDVKRSVAIAPSELFNQIKI